MGLRSFFSKFISTSEEQIEKERSDPGSLSGVADPTEVSGGSAESQRRIAETTGLPQRVVGGGGSSGGSRRRTSGGGGGSSGGGGGSSGGKSGQPKLTPDVQEKIRTGTTKSKTKTQPKQIGKPLITQQEAREMGASSRDFDIVRARGFDDVISDRPRETARFKTRKRPTGVISPVEQRGGTSVLGRGGLGGQTTQAQEEELLLEERQVDIFRPRGTTIDVPITDVFVIDPETGETIREATPREETRFRGQTNVLEAGEGRRIPVLSRINDAVERFEDIVSKGVDENAFFRNVKDIIFDTEEFALRKGGRWEELSFEDKKDVKSRARGAEAFAFALDLATPLDLRTPKPVQVEFLGAEQQLLKRGAVQTDLLFETSKGQVGRARGISKAGKDDLVLSQIEGKIGKQGALSGEFNQQGAFAGRQVSKQRPVQARVRRDIDGVAIEKEIFADLQSSIGEIATAVGRKLTDVVVSLRGAIRKPVKSLRKSPTKSTSLVVREGDLTGIVGRGETPRGDITDFKGIVKRREGVADDLFEVEGAFVEPKPRDISITTSKSKANLQQLKKQDTIISQKYLEATADLTAKAVQDFSARTPRGFVSPKTPRTKRPTATTKRAEVKTTQQDLSLTRQDLSLGKATRDLSIPTTSTRQRSAARTRTRTSQGTGIRNLQSQRTSLDQGVRTRQAQRQRELQRQRLLFRDVSTGRNIRTPLRLGTPKRSSPPRDRKRAKPTTRKKEREFDDDLFVVGDFTGRALKKRQVFTSEQELRRFAKDSSLKLFRGTPVLKFKGKKAFRGDLP